MEAWHGAIGWLKGGLSASDLSVLVDKKGMPQWAKIVPFENQQLTDLARLVTDLDAFILLTTAVQSHYPRLDSNGNEWLPN